MNDTNKAQNKIFEILIFVILYLLMIVLVKNKTKNLGEWTFTIVITTVIFGLFICLWHFSEKIKHGLIICYILSPLLSLLYTFLLNYYLIKKSSYIPGFCAFSTSCLLSLIDHKDERIQNFYLIEIILLITYYGCLGYFIFRFLS